MEKKNYILIFLIALGIFTQVSAQDNFQVKNSSNNVLMEVRNEGVLIKNVTTSERSTIGATLSSADNGILVYDNQEKKFYTWKDTGWVELEDSTNEIQNLSSVLGQNNDGGNTQIKNIADPTEAQDAATKAYVDQLEDQVAALSLLFVNEKYGTIVINGKTWLASNLDIETPNSVCYK